MSLVGCLKSDVPYNPREKQISRAIYAQEQGKKLKKMSSSDIHIYEF